MVQAEWVKQNGIGAIEVISLPDTKSSTVYARAMKLPTDWLEAVLLAVLLVGIPAMALRMRRAREELLRRPRAELYRHSILWQWSLTAAVLAAIYYGSVPGGLPGLTVPSLPISLLATLAVLVALLGIGRAFARREDESRAIVLKLIPRTSMEKGLFLVLALTAGICEEFLYRGFVISRLSSLFSSIIWPSLLSTAAFALTHAYQGGFGMLRAFVMGWALVAAYFWSGSLIPCMIGHAMIDLLVGFYLGPQRLRHDDYQAE